MSLHRQTLLLCLTALALAAPLTAQAKTYYVGGGLKLTKRGTWSKKNLNPWGVGFQKRWSAPAEIKTGDQLVFIWNTKANVYQYNGGDEGDYDACLKNSERGTMLAPTSLFGRYTYKAEESCVTLFFASTVGCKKGLKFKTSVAC
ncbi:hypothetical protein CLOM_g7052 [Closterium sp. NIES-68]|nr:hypothetical protein CLOM_g7052 [Closterium sp. NIES-68]GJP62392.1 hypothetical protein CLOP_g19462 [Closterium sp. NIES-67]